MAGEDGTNKPTENPTDKPPEKPTEPIYPLVLFATTENTSKEAVNKAFKGEGLGVQFVANADELGEAVTKPEVFLIIVDVEFANKRGIAYQAQFKSSTSAFWIALAKKLTTQQRSGLYAAGFADVLTHPVHPVLFKGRARMLLTRYLKTHDLPEYVELPSGISRPNRPGSGGSKNSSGGADSKNNENKGPYFGAGGSQNNGGAEWNNKISSGKDSPHDNSSVHIKGGQDNNAEWNHHKAGKEDSDPQWNHHKAGKDDSDPQWNHHKAGNDDTDPQWNHHKSAGNEKPADWNNHKSESKQDEAIQNKIIQSEKQNQGSNFKIVESDKNESAWNNKSSQNPISENSTATLNSQSSERNASTQIQRETAALPSSNPNSWKVEGESKPVNFGVVNAEKQFETEIQKGIATNKRAEEETRVRIESSLGLPITPKFQQKESQDLNAIKEKIQALKQNQDWDRKIFETSILPEGSPADICSRGLRKCTLELKELFFSVAKTLKARRITMISLKATAMPQDEILPTDLYALCSSDGAIANNEQIPSAYFPQITAAFSLKTAVFLNEPLPDPFEGKLRPANWKIEGKIEKSSAVFPIFLADKPYAVLLLQFETERSDADIPILEQAISFLGIPEIHYSQVDFLSRVYRRPATQQKAA